MPAVVFTPAAQAEVIEASDWYDQQSPGLAVRLVAEIDRLVGRMASSPLQFPVVRRDIRRALLRRFPYALFFRIAGDQVQVIACFHTSRDPRRWRERV